VRHGFNESGPGETLSECEINAYFIDPKTIARAFGSKDAALKKKVLKDASGIIANCRGRFDDDDALAHAVGQFIDGTPSDDDFLKGFCRVGHSRGFSRP
jgi:hypothetical protein